MEAKIDVRYIPEFEKKFSKIAKKAEKFGLPVPSFTIKSMEKVVDPRFSFSRCVVYQDVATIEFIDVDIIIGNDWVIAGEIKTEALSGTVSKSNVEHNRAIYISYRELPKSCYEKPPMLCEHCGVNRYRKHTYILLNTKTEEYKQVGSSCVHDFVHVQNVEQILSWFEYLTNYLQVAFEESMTGTHEYPSWYKVENVLPFAVFVVNKLGVVKYDAKSKEFQRHAKYLFNALKNNSISTVEYDSMVEHAHNVRAYFKNLLDEVYDATSIFAEDLNLAKVMSSEYVSGEFSTLETICHGVDLYNTREIRRQTEIERKERQRAYAAERAAKEVEYEKRKRAYEELHEKKLMSEFIGTEGDKKVKIDNLKIVAKKEVNSSFGNSILLTMLVNDKDIVKSFVNANSKAYTQVTKLSVNDVISIVCNIKKHETYEGVKSTMVNYLTVLHINSHFPIN